MHVFLLLYDNEMDNESYNRVDMVYIYNHHNTNIYSALSMHEQPAQSEQKQKYYLHSEVHPHSQRTILRHYHCYDRNNNYHYQAIAIVNHNTIEIYRNTGTRVIYENVYQFMANISVLEVLPVKGNHSDVLFIADQLGRWMFWTNEQAALAGSNLLKNIDMQIPLYQRVPAEDKQPQFSGITANFNSLQTQAVLFFTVGTKIVIFKVRWSRGRIVMANPPTEVTCPYMDVNYMSMVNGKQAYIGIIQQREEKTFLRLHRAVSQHFECILSLQKTNLSSFFTNSYPSSSSLTQFQQLVTVTNNQLSIYNLKTQQVFCTFQITQPGHICALDSDLYIYVGELASQMIVFNRKHYKNYGGFMLENFVCMGIAAAGRLSDGGHLIAVLDQGHTVQFIALYEQQWRSIKSIASTSSIFSIQSIQHPPQCLIVRGCQNSFQVGLLRLPQTCPLLKQSPVSSPILSIYPLLQGRSLILCTVQSNTVLNYNAQLNNYQLSFQFQNGNIVDVLGKYVIMDKQIYQVDLSINKNNIRELWVEKNGIVSAVFDGKFIGVLVLDGYYKFYNVQTKQVDRIRKGCSQMYIHKFIKNETLLCSYLSQPGQLTLVPVFKQDSTITLPHMDLISDMVSFDEYLVVSYCNKCIVEVYQFNSSNIKSNALTSIYTVQGSSQPLLLVKWAQGVLAYGSKQAHLIKIVNNSREQKISHYQIQFDSFKDIVSVVYLQFNNKFIVTHPDTISVYDLPQPSPIISSNFKQLTDIFDPSPPFVTHRPPYNTYIAQPYQIMLRHSNTAQLIKKQSHGLKEVCCIQKLQAGLLVCGVNDMDVVQLFVFHWLDLSIVMSQALGNKVEKKMPTSAKRKYQYGNQFFIRDENSITLYTLKAQDAHSSSSSSMPQSYTLKQIFSSKISLQGYTLAIRPQLSMIMASDPLRYTVVYDYRLGKLVSLCRYQSLNTINDVEFIDDAVVVADCVGGVQIVQFGFNQPEGIKTNMVQVGRIDIGAQVTCINKIYNNKDVIYGTLSGYIGKVQTISVAQFQILKKVQQEILNILEQGRNQLRYQEWRSRFNLQDKLIDAFLIEKYIHSEKQKHNKNKDKKSPTNEFDELCRLWKSIKSR